MYKLEKYRGINSRYTCPQCGAKHEFVRYVDPLGKYLAEDVGKCNREAKCRYHKKPREFFAENPDLSKISPRQKSENIKPTQLSVLSNQKKTFGSIDFDQLKQSLKNYERKTLNQFLTRLFIDDSDSVQKVIQKYFVGTWKDGSTVFWQIDQNRKIRTGKLMKFDIETGKRQVVKTWIENGEQKELKAYWLHKELIHRKVMPKDFKIKQCFFGQHLLIQDSVKTVAIVESEKTALICSICFPDKIWLAAGGKSNLSIERLLILKGRKVLLYPDADAYSDWKNKADQARGNIANVKFRV
jgi:hypothetical protein